jgi:magnesium transporter
MPKFDPLANDGAFIAAFAIRLDQGRSPRLQATAVALVVGPAYLISLHREPVPELTTRFEAMLGSEPERLADSGPGLAHAVLDAMIDRHLPVMLQAAEAAEELEDQLDPQAERRGLSALEHLIVLRRDLLAFRRLAVAQQEVLRRVGRTFPEAHAAFSDVADNQREAIDTGAATCDYVDGAIEAYRVRRDAQTEEGVRWLTILAGILGPLSLLIGFWQLNFPNIPGSGWSWGWPVFVGLQLCFIALSLWHFRRRGML